VLLLLKKYFCRDDFYPVVFIVKRMVSFPFYLVTSHSLSDCEHKPTDRRTNILSISSNVITFRHFPEEHWAVWLEFAYKKRSVSAVWFFSLAYFTSQISGCVASQLWG
jgi:hypothetical protein